MAPAEAYREAQSTRQSLMAKTKEDFEGHGWSQKFPWNWIEAQLESGRRQTRREPKQAWKHEAQIEAQSERRTWKS